MPKSSSWTEDDVHLLRHVFEALRAVVDWVRHSERAGALQIARPDRMGSVSKSVGDRAWALTGGGVVMPISPGPRSTWPGKSRPGTRGRDLIRLLDETVEAGFPLRSLETVAEDLAAVTPDDVRAEASACLAGAPVLSLVGDEAAIRLVVDGAWPLGVP